MNLSHIDEPPRPDEPLSVTAEDELGFPEILRFLRHRLERDLWDRPILIDARAATLNVTVADMEELLQAVRQSSVSAPPARTALLTSNPVNYGTARMYMSFATEIDPEFAVFHDVDVALAWLAGRG
jgi:hypothetical protein